MKSIRKLFGFLRNTTQSTTISVKQSAQIFADSLTDDEKADILPLLKRIKINKDK